MIPRNIRGIGPYLLPIVFAAGLCVGAAQAQGVPTVDVTSIAKLGEMIAQAKLQVKALIASNLKLDTQIVKQIQQITTLKAQLDALKNGLTLDALGIPDIESFFKDILPDVADLSGGLLAAKDGKYELMTTSGKVGDQSVKDFVAEFFGSAGLNVATVDALAKSEDEGAARIGTQANTAAFLSAAAESSSARASESLERAHDLVQEIPDTEGLKEAVDLNTRVTAELSIALANIWSAESAQLMGMGEAGVMDAATAAEEEKFIKVIGEK